MLVLCAIGNVKRNDDVGRRKMEAEEKPIWA
jgi:hypothetical protein